MLKNKCERSACINIDEIKVQGRSNAIDGMNSKVCAKGCCGFRKSPLVLGSNKKTTILSKIKTKTHDGL
jgi:hypothetical protein